MRVAHYNSNNSSLDPNWSLRGRRLIEHLSEIVITVVTFAALIGQWMTDLHTMPNRNRPPGPEEQ